MTEAQQIQKGFNHGYQLQKLQPDLARTIQDGFPDKDHPYAKGFMAGSQEYTKEQTKEKSSYLPDTSRLYFSKGQEKIRDDRGIEP